MLSVLLALTAGHSTATTIPFLTAQAKSTPTLAVPIGPSAPAGSSGAFSRQVLAVEKALAAGNFEQAAKQLAKLPTLKPTVRWNDAKVPAIRKAEFASARSKAFDLWRSLPGFSPVLASKGRIDISFEDSLPENADSLGPAGATFFISAEPNEPNVEAIIALKRGTQKVTVDASDIVNEAAYAIGAYYGLERQPGTGSVMGRTDLPNKRPLTLLPVDLELVKRNLAIVEQLRAFVRQKKKIIAAQPQLFFDPKLLTTTPTIQGKSGEMSLMIVNKGTGDLQFRIVPDCGCFTLRYVGTVKAGDTGLVSILADTSEFPAGVQKKLYLQSNDPDASLRIVPVRFDVIPRYRFLLPGQGDTVYLDQQGASAEIILALNPDAPFKPTGYFVDGLLAIVKESEWDGALMDGTEVPAFSKRIGKKYSILIGPNAPAGRNAVTLTVKTDDEILPQIRSTIYVQKGIVALPSSLYLGEIGKTPARAVFYLTRPNRPFKVTKVVSDSPRLTATVEPVGADDTYKVIVSFDGKADFGNFGATLNVQTDDSEQPTIPISVFGVIR